MAAGDQQGGALVRARQDRAADAVGPGAGLIVFLDKAAHLVRLGQMHQAGLLELLEVVAHFGGVHLQPLAQLGEGGRFGHQYAQDLHPAGVAEHFEVVDLIN